jgi:hypothetical protein
MIFGAITNSWRQQLEGQDLAILVQEAQTRGARHTDRKYHIPPNLVVRP